MSRPQRIAPGPGQESVWDYPRPPRLVLDDRPVRVVFNGEVVAETARAYRVLETSHPPTYYIPPADVATRFLERTSRATFCEWKGRARYHAIRVGDRVAVDAAWSYPDPTPAFRPIRDYLAFYASKVDECTVGGIVVRTQPGDFYGGWITPDVVGPFKGDPGTMGW